MRKVVSTGREAAELLACDSLIPRVSFPTVGRRDVCGASAALVRNRMLAGRHGLRALAVTIALLGGRADGAALLRVGAAPMPTETPGIELSAANDGDADAAGVTPVVVSQHVSATGEPVSLAPGARHVWHLSLPPPPPEGSVAAIARVRWTGADGEVASAPAVAVLAAPGATTPAVGATLLAEPLARVANMRLALENRGDRPVAGRVVAVLPSGITTEPESQAVTVGARSTATVPIMLDASQARADRDYPAYALFEYTDGTLRRAVAAATTLRAARERGSRRPLVVGAVASLAMLAVLAFALARSRRR